MTADQAEKTSTTSAPWTIRTPALARELRSSGGIQKAENATTMIRRGMKNLVT